MKWTQIEGMIYSPHRYRQEDGWELIFDKNPSTPRWVICHRESGASPPGVDAKNAELGPDQVAEAQAWADRVLEPVLRDNRSLGVTWNPPTR